MRYTQCRYCWTYVLESECRTVWLSELYPVICRGCEESDAPRARQTLELEETLAVSRRGVTL